MTARAGKDFFFFFYDKRDYSNFPIVNFTYKYVATFQHMECTFLSWYDIPDSMTPITLYIIEGCC
jgi:hypothetical protein